MKKSNSKLSKYTEKEDKYDYLTTTLEAQSGEDIWTLFDPEYLIKSNDYVCDNKTKIIELKNEQKES